MLRIAATLLLLGALIGWADPQELAGALRQIEPMLWLASAVAICCATLVGGINLHLMLREHSQRAFNKFLPLYWIAWAVGLVTPGQIGDLAAVSFMLKRRGIDWRATLGRSLLDKAISLTVVLLLATAALVTTWQQLSFQVDAMGWAIGLSLVGATAITALALRRHPRLQAFRRHAFEIGSVFMHTLRHRPAIVALNAVLTVLKMMLIGAAYWLVFCALGQTRLEFLPTVALATASGLLAYLPVSFNGIGPVEAGGVVLFGIHGVDATTVIAGYLLLRATVLGLAWLPAALFLLTLPPPQQ